MNENHKQGEPVAMKYYDEHGKDKFAKIFGATHPAPADAQEKKELEFGMNGEKMFFAVGVQMFTLDYEPQTTEDFEFMEKILTDAISNITHNVKTAPAVAVNEPDPSKCFNAAINYALKCGFGDGGLEFLACWREGNFDAIRKEWPDAPSAVFEGAETAKKGGV